MSSESVLKEEQFYSEQAEEKKSVTDKIGESEKENKEVYQEENERHVLKTEKIYKEMIQRMPPDFLKELQSHVRNCAKQFQGLIKT